MYDEADALHEAGHAVAGRLLGRRVDLITIEPGKYRTGACWSAPRPVRGKLPSATAPLITWAGSWQRDLSSGVAVLLAGGMAEVLFAPRLPETGRAPETVADKVRDRLSAALIAAPEATKDERERAAAFMDGPAGQTDDEQIAALVLAACCGDLHRAGPWLAWIEAETAVMLRLNEAAVRRMAALLMVRGTVGAAAARAALREVVR